MKRIALLTILSLATLSNLYAGAQRVVSREVMTTGGTLQGTWDDVQNPNNVTYNSTAKCYVTKATHTGSGYSHVIVYGTNITKTPIVGAGTDGTLVKSEDWYEKGLLVGKRFTFQHPKDMSGQFVSFYSEGNTVLSSTDRFLRYP